MHKQLTGSQVCRPQQSKFSRGGRYWIQEKIGQGTFATVYRATDKQYDCSVALKVINLPPLTRGKEDVMEKATKVEVELFESLDHENIVKCFQHFEDIHGRNRVLIMVLEYIEGGDLEQWIHKRTTLRSDPNQWIQLIPEVTIWCIFEQIASAVAYIHSKRILHRDLKPANVLLTNKLRVKLTDFGLSRRQNQASGAKTVCGTPYYMAPERINERGYSFVSDVWALGCILYEMVALASPFIGETGNITSLVEKIENADYPPIPEDCYSEQLVILMEACLCADPLDRPNSVEVHEVAKMMIQTYSNPSYNL